MNEPSLLVVVSVALALFLRLFWRLIVNLVVVGVIAMTVGGVAWVAAQAVPGT